METPGNLNRPSSGLSRETLTCALLVLHAGRQTTMLRFADQTIRNLPALMPNLRGASGDQLCNTLPNLTEVREFKKRVFR